MTEGFEVFRPPGSPEANLADAIQRAIAIREASWDGSRYTIAWSDAAATATTVPAWRELIAPMMQSGFSDFTDWADRYATAPKSLS